MPNIQKYEQKLEKIEEQMKPYEDPNLPNKLKQIAKKQYSPLMKSAIKSKEEQRGDYLGRFFGLPAQYKTTAADLSPRQVFGQMGTDLGMMLGKLEATTRVADYYEAQANQAGQNMIQAAQLGLDALSQKYQRAYQRYQLAWQEAENAKNRAAQQVQWPAFGEEAADYKTAWQEALEEGNPWAAASAWKQWSEKGTGAPDVTKVAPKVVGMMPGIFKSYLPSFMQGSSAATQTSGLSPLSSNFAKIAQDVAKKSKGLY